LFGVNINKVSRLSKENSKFSDGNSFIDDLFESLIALVSTEPVERSILLTLFCEEFNPPLTKKGLLFALLFIGTLPAVIY
jgi:hypothetical protein